MLRTTTRLTAALCLMALVAAAWPAAAQALPSVPSTKFTVAQGCGCHATLLEQWSRTMHSKALSDPLYQAKLDEANRATDGVLGKFCEDCHGPIAGMAGMNGKGAKARDAVANEGITCDFCHHVTGTSAPIANNSWIIQPDGTKRAQLKDSRSPAHTTGYSAYHETAEFCGACHNVNHPGNGLALEATYSEWKNSEYAKKGVTCQDCHMTPGPGVTKPNPGRAAAMAPERPHLYMMSFAGANVALGDAAKATENLQGAAELKVEAAEVVAPGAKGEVKVTVTNSGAGHYLPTGLTEVRECWLQVTATDASGAEVFTAREDFHTVLKDAKGNAPVELWDAVGVKADTRIPPKGSKAFEYTYDMPSSGPVKLEAAMYYRSAPEELAKKAGVEVPTVEMVAFRQDVFGTAEELSKAKTGGDVKAPAEGATPAIIMIIGIVLLVIIGGAFAVRGLIARKRA